MKISYFAVIILFIFTIALPAQVITVNAPSAETTWYKGQTENITWNKSGTMDSNVKLTLRNADDSLNMVITMSTSNSGSYSWTIPHSIPDGTYMLRIKTTDNLVWDNSDPFSIADLPPFVSTGTISVTSPGAGTEFLVTQWAINVSWGNTGSNHERVSLEAIPEGASSGTFIEADTPNDDDYQWMNPGTLTGAGRFFIRVKTLDGNVYGDSAVFQVNELPVPASRITVTGPDPEANWNVGSPRMIYWRKSGEMDGHVRIDIYNETGTTLVTPVYDNTLNDESEHWVVPAGHAAGRYIMRITTMDGLVRGDSAVFLITRPDDPGSDPRTPTTEEESPPADPRTPIVPSKTIKIKSPNRRSYLRSGQKAEIAWTRSLSMHKKVRIELFMEGRLSKSGKISSQTENDGSYLWTVPPVMSGGKYLIKVTTLDGNDYGISEVFTINSKLRTLNKIK